MQFSERLCEIVLKFVVTEHMSPDQLAQNLALHSLSPKVLTPVVADTLFSVTISSIVGKS